MRQVSVLITIFPLSPLFEQQMHLCPSEHPWHFPLKNCVFGHIVAKATERNCVIDKQKKCLNGAMAQHFIVSVFIKNSYIHLHRQVAQCVYTLLNTHQDARIKHFHSHVSRSVSSLTIRQICHHNTVAIHHHARPPGFLIGNGRLHSVCFIACCPKSTPMINQGHKYSPLKPCIRWSYIFFLLLNQPPQMHLWHAP